VLLEIAARSPQYTVAAAAIPAFAALSSVARWLSGDAFLGEFVFAVGATVACAFRVIGRGRSMGPLKAVHTATHHATTLGWLTEPAVPLGAAEAAREESATLFAVAGLPTRGSRVAACVSPHSTALARARGYLGPGLCASGVQSVLEPVVGVAGDVVELGPGR
jgi:hypothetical protein